MAIQDDWTINYGAKTITHSAGTTIYTVNALYSWLMDLFDELAQMDDAVPMSAQTPTAYLLINGWTFGAAATDIQFLKGGAITDTGDDTVWANVYTIGSDTVISSITLYIEQNGSVLSGWWSAGHINLLIKIKDAGSFIDSGVLTVYAREWTYTYDHYEMDLSAGGRQPAPIAVVSDAGNQTASGTVAAYNIDVTFGDYDVDVDQSGADENYEIELDLNSTHTVAEAYEYLKYLTRRGETATLDSPAVQGQIYQKADAAYTAVKAAPFGTFAGGNLFGARGLHLKLAERPASQANLYELIDSDGNSGITEPTSITIEITGLDVTGAPAVDRILVARTSGGNLLDDQYATAATGNDSGSGTVTIVGSPDADTPPSGTIRLQGKRYEYTNYSGSVFTLSGVTGEDNNSVDAFVPFLDHLASDKSSVGVSYSTDRTVLARVRQKGIIPFETTGTITVNGYSVQAIRTADGVVT